MAHEIAKLMLDHSHTFLERTEAVKTALSLGMPLRQIEDYLDWLDLMVQPANEETSRPHHRLDRRPEPEAGV